MVGWLAVTCLNEERRHENREWDLEVSSSTLEQTMSYGTDYTRWSGVSVASGLRLIPLSLEIVASLAGSVR